MVIDSKALLAQTYETDETAWLERMAELVGRKQYDQLDYTHLQEFLNDMARRDRREAHNRLVVLLLHVLKWDLPSDRRTGSWRATIRTQKGRLRRLLESGTLRNHANAVLQDAYQEAVELARDETGLPTDAFPSHCPFTLEALLHDPPDAEGESTTT